MAVPELTRTAQGHELRFATKLPGPFRPGARTPGALADGGGARIVPLSYSAHLHSPVVFGDLDGRFRPYDPRRAYAESKTAAVLLAVEATRRWAGDGIYFEGVSEAAVRTESPRMFGIGVADYALEPRYAELLWEVATEMLAPT
jgi:NAD(P)-dependent dehydrogenase (short-subunit alcohol dehydrogenase family)